MKREINPETSATLGTQIRYKFPTTGYVHNIAIKNGWAQTTTASMSAYYGAVSIARVEIESGGEIIAQYHYKPVFEWYLGKLDGEEAMDKMLLAAGGTFDTSTATSYTMVPIPTFFDPILIKGVAPLNLSKFKTQPELVITYESATDSTLPTGTGAAISSSKMVLYMSDTSSVLKNLHNNEDYFYKSIDFYTNVKNDIATATETDIDISGLKGQIKMLYLRSSTKANVDTAKVYYSNQEIGSVKTNMDGHEEQIFRQKEEGEFDNIIYGRGKGFNSTLGYGYIVPYSYYQGEGMLSNNVGGIHSSKVNKHVLKITHAIGANCYYIEKNKQCTQFI
jgi:hypothetical protein